MDTRQLLVWLELVPDGRVPERMGVVCRRHADAMVVPRGWTLDDRRESRPRLFRVSASDEAKVKPKRVRKPHRDLAVDHSPGGSTQLSFGIDPSAEPVHGAADDVLDDEVTVGEIRPTVAAGIDADETQAIPWRFEFDQDDDLGGLLRADSPLLSRAFRGAQRRD